MAENKLVTQGYKSILIGVITPLITGIGDYTTTQIYRYIGIVRKPVHILQGSLLNNQFLIEVSKIFFVAHVVSGAVILDVFFWVINFTPKTSGSCLNKKGICSRILPNLDLFFG